MIYFMQSLDGGPVKIGTTTNVEKRHRQLESYYGCKLALLATTEGGSDEEKALHTRFADLRLGKTEQFKPAPELMAFIGRPLLVSPNPDAVEAIEPKNDNTTIVFTCTSAFKEWLQEIAETERSTVPQIIDRALVLIAKERGYSVPPGRL